MLNKEKLLKAVSRRKGKELAQQQRAEKKKKADQEYAEAMKEAKKILTQPLPEVAEDVPRIPTQLPPEEEDEIREIPRSEAEGSRLKRKAIRKKPSKPKRVKILDPSPPTPLTPRSKIPSNEPTPETPGKGIVFDEETPEAAPSKISGAETTINQSAAAGTKVPEEPATQKEAAPAAEQSGPSSSSSSGQYDPGWNVRSNDSALFSNVAIRLIEGICMPRDKPHFYGQPSDIAYRGLCRNLAEGSHQVVAIFKHHEAAQKQLRVLQKSVDELNAQVESKEVLLIEQAGKIEDYSRQLDEVKTKKTELENELLEERVGNSILGSEILSKDLIITQLLADIKEVKSELKRKESELEEKNSELTEKERIWSAEREKMEKVQAEAKQEAVEAYKASEECEDEKVGYSDAAFELGFNMAKEELTKLFNLPKDQVDAVKLVEPEAAGSSEGDSSSKGYSPTEP